MSKVDRLIYFTKKHDEIRAELMTVPFYQQMRGDM